MVGKSIAVAVVGIPVVVEGIGISFRSSGSSGLGISRPLAIVVAVETAIGKSVEEPSVDGGHNRGSSHKRVAVGSIVSVSIGSGLSCHGSKEAKSSNGHGFHHFGQFAS